MQHQKHFSEQRVVQAITARNLDDVLAELVQVFVTTGDVDKSLARKILAASREKVAQGATGAIGNGVAIPHVKLKGVENSLVVLGRSDEGLDFRAGDGVPVTVVFFVIGPADAAEEHLSLLRWIASLARNHDFPRFAQACKTPADLLDLLEELDAAP